MTLHDPNIPSNRIRHLNQWLVYGYPANKEGLTIYRLAGLIVSEADGSKPKGIWTETSPIVSCEGNVVTTVTGSKYHLLLPNLLCSTYIPNIDEDCYVPEKYWNKWIEGNNWKTI